MLVLKGNIPRFPWEPSTTTLTYRLAGTTEASVSYRDGQKPFWSLAAPGAHPLFSPTQPRADRQHLRSPRRAQRALGAAPAQQAQKLT